MTTNTFSKLSMEGKIAGMTGSMLGLGENIAHMFADRDAQGHRHLWAECSQR